MDISIFVEEEPTDEILGRLRYGMFPLTLIPAAHNPVEFRETRRKILAARPHTKLILWPTFYKESSHWISPLSNRHELLAVESWLQSLTRDDVAGYMLDLELPTLQLSMMKKNFWSFSKNKKLIKQMAKIAQKRGLELYTAEYPAIDAYSEFLKGKLGVSLPQSYGHTAIPMWYSSVLKDVGNKIGINLVRLTFAHIKRQIKQGRKLCVGVGVTTSAGIGGSMSVLSAHDLDRDLHALQSIGVTCAAVYHLAGMTPEHFAVCSKYVR